MSGGDTGLDALVARLELFRERIAATTAATNMSADSQAIAIAMITTMYGELFEEISIALRTAATKAREAAR